MVVWLTTALTVLFPSPKRKVPHLIYAYNIILQAAYHNINVVFPHLCFSICMDIYMEQQQKKIEHSMSKIWGRQKEKLIKSNLVSERGRPIMFLVPVLFFGSLLVS